MQDSTYWQGADKYPALLQTTLLSFITSQTELCHCSASQRIMINKCPCKGKRNIIFNNYWKQIDCVIKYIPSAHSERFLLTHIGTADLAPAPWCLDFRTRTKNMHWNKNGKLWREMWASSHFYSLIQHPMRSYRNVQYYIEEGFASS